MEQQAQPPVNTGHEVLRLFGHRDA